MAANLEIRRHSWTLDDFKRLVDTGILGKDDHVELIDGELVEMPPVGGAHVGTVIVLTTLLSRKLDGRALISVQNSLALRPRSAPQPDIAVLDWRLFRKAHLPGPEDVHLAIEVAHGTITYDRDVKMPLYARHGIREYWLVDVEASCVVVYREPSGTGYQESFTVSAGGTLDLLAFPDVRLTVDDLWVE